jgi:hypothetical protein
MRALSAWFSRASKKSSTRVPLKYGALSVFGVGMGTVSVCIEVKREPVLDAVAELPETDGVMDEAGGVGLATPAPLGGTVVTPLCTKPCEVGLPEVLAGPLMPGPEG